MTKCESPDKLKKTFLFILILFLFSFSASWASTINIKGSVIDVDHGKRIIYVKTGKSLETKLIYDSKTRFMSRGKRISPFSVIPGDHVNARVSGAGIIGSITVNGESHAGEVVFISKEKLLTADGMQIYFFFDVKFYVNGILSGWKDIPVGCRIYTRVNPTAELAGSVYAIDFRKQVSKSGDSPPEIWKIDIPGKKLFRKNEKINVIVKARGKKKVCIDIPGIATGIPLKEVKPGTYKGSYKFNRNSIRRTYVIAHISDKKGYSCRICPLSINVAITGPRIIPVYPGKNETIRENSPSIFARFIPGGALVKASSIGVIIDGKRIKSGLDRNVGFISCKIPQLKPGKHSIKIVVSDEAGNQRSKKWYFNIK